MCSEKLPETSWMPGSFHMLQPAAVVLVASVVVAAEVAEEVTEEMQQ